MLEVGIAAGARVSKDHGGQVAEKIIERATREARERVASIPPT